MQAYAAPLSGSAGQTFAVAPAPAGSTDAPQISQTLGAGATAYTDQTANRALSTVYTNNTGRPLWVIVVVELVLAANSSTAVDAYVNGLIVSDDPVINPQTVSAAVASTVRLLVPIGATYEIITTASISKWYEY